MVKIKNFFSKFLFIFTLFISKEFNFLYYNSSDSPDFPTYFNYFRYFFQEIENTSREQGLFYYFLNSLNFYNFAELITEENFFIYVHRSIQQTNFYLYLFGAVGLYYLLKHFTFSQSSIFYTLSLLNVLPVTIAMRIVLKPEIIGFAMLPWIILCFEKFLVEKKFSYLYLAIPFTSLAISSKGSVLVMISSYIIIFYFRKIIIFKFTKVLLLSITFIIVILGIYIEDSSANEGNLINLQSGSVQGENYDFKAPKNILYKVDIYKLFTSPKKYDHSSSMVGITLLDTFGDYFDVYWDNDSSNYSLDRKVVFQIEESKSIKAPNIDFVNKKITLFDQKVPDLYLREFLGLILSILFFIYVFLYAVKKNYYSKFIVAPFFGLSILLVHIITGYPVNNFDPSKGDTLKTLYYSFFILLSFVFLCVQVLENKKFKALRIMPIVLVMIFLLGFPKENSVQSSINISNINEYSYFCNFNNTVILERQENGILSKCEKGSLTPVQGFSSYAEYTNYKTAPKFPIFNILVAISTIVSSLVLVNMSYKKTY